MPPTVHLPGRLAVAPVVLALSALLGGCATKQEAARKAGPPATKVKAASVRIEDGKQLVIRAQSRDDGGLFFTRPPYELNGTWRAEVAAGMFDDASVAAVGGTVFGLEVDLLSGGNVPAEFYGVYARRFASPAGLQVFCSSEDGNHGQIFLNDATVVDLAIETDGATVTFFARSAGSGGGYQTVGSRSLQSPAGRHYAGFGMFGAPDRATLAFTRFRVPVNGPLPEGRPAETVALQALYQAAFDVLEAAYAVAGPIVTNQDAVAADAALAQAESGLAEARALVAALPDPAKKAKTPAERALRELGRAEKDVAKARKALGKKGPRAAKSVLKLVTRKMLRAALAATDALISDDLRETLPGDGLDGLR